MGQQLALRIPRAFAFQSKIHEDEYVNLTLEKNKIVIEPIKDGKYLLNKLISGINKSNLHS